MQPRQQACALLDTGQPLLPLSVLVLRMSDPCCPGRGGREQSLHNRSPTGRLPPSMSDPSCSDRASSEVSAHPRDRNLAESEDLHFAQPHHGF